MNLGTGKSCSCSVLELVKAFEVSAGKVIPYCMGARCPNDIATCYAGSSLAKSILGWSENRNIDTKCRDTWNWQSNNPQGYSN
jgi:UDP-glucose 4-epimerase